ncbi:hypothetical protein Hdeb2414_s0006g00205581 [Helianthus debilis subsp. tardiflorus]
MKFKNGDQSNHGAVPNGPAKLADFVEEESCKEGSRGEFTYIVYTLGP